MTGTLQKALEELKQKKIHIGWLEGAKYPDGTPVAEAAAVQELGSQKDHIPPRPFFRPTIAARSNEWKKQYGDGSKAIFDGKETAGSVMQKIGLGIVGDVKKTISQITTPPLKSSTIEARRNRLKNGQGASSTIDKPLVDTGYMLNSLTSEVSDK